MLDSLYIAATGMHAEQAHLDAVSNNLANLNTTAYKKSTVNFSDLLYKDATTATSDIQQLTEQVAQGLGSSVANLAKDFSTGDLKATENPLHLAIRGQGFFEVELANGEVAYTRNGSLRIDVDGYLETVDGFRLAPRIQLPPDATQVIISASGLVQAQVGENNDIIEVGQLELANFVNTAGLEAIGNNLYLGTDQSGVPAYSRPGEFGAGEVAQGYLESSNVDLVQELLELVVAQRAYEVNSQVIRASDEILKINNNLRS